MCIPLKEEREGTNNHIMQLWIVGLNGEEEEEQGGGWDPPMGPWDRMKMGCGFE